MRPDAQDLDDVVAGLVDARDSRARAASACGAYGTRRTVASSMVTQVPSVPTSARATLKPFSGSSSSRV